MVGRETSMLRVKLVISTKTFFCWSLRINSFSDDCKTNLIEFTIKTWKWVCIYLLSHHHSMKNNLLTTILNKVTCWYDNTIFIGDLNLTVDNNKNLEVFMAKYDLKCFIKKATSFHSATPSCIDLILSNKKEF